MSQYAVGEGEGGGGAVGEMRDDKRVRHASRFIEKDHVSEICLSTSFHEFIGAVRATVYHLRVWNAKFDFLRELLQSAARIS